jgi:hypothetical protein
MDKLRCATIGFVAFAGTGLAALPAIADGGPYPGPPPTYLERPSIWQGLYVGAHIGWGSSGDLDGVVGGGQVGYKVSKTDHP